MRSACKIFTTTALLVGAACTGKGTETGDTGVTLPPPGERVASEKARETDPAVSDATLATLTEGNRAFATDLYHVIAKPGENLFFSPHSISVALAMTYAGAQGTTETEMADTLHFTLPEDYTHASFNALDLALQSRDTLPIDETGDGFQLSIVNQTWGQTGFSFASDFLDVLAVNYGAGMYLLDFASDPEGCRGEINDWVASVTADRITDLLPDGSITSDTRLVLANAIYFKASWSVPFDTADTTSDPFTPLEGSAVTVPMMHGEIETTYASGDGWALATVPYVGEDLDMALLVPDAGRFDEVEAELDQPFLDAALGALGTYDVTLSMPRFTFRTEADLVDPLKSLGMNAAFDPGLADFTGMSAEGGLTVSGVYHQAFVSVEETGTEAAAATAVAESGTAEPERATLTVDRPFILLIRDRPTGAVLFLGRVLDPTAG